MEATPGMIFALLLLTVARALAQSDVQDIIRKSIAANDVDWQAAPGYSFVERDVETKGDTTTVKTYQVTMIEGSPYNRLIAVGDKPLSKTQDAQEKRKMEQEIAGRRRESPGARAKRVAKYQRERRQDHAMMQEMTAAFRFTLLRSERLAGRDTYVLQAAPRPGYQPKSRDARVLTGMKGTLWIDKKQYHWAKVEAEVIKPVSFGFFIAKVGPGTRFMLEQAPVSDKLWLPRHFNMRVKASVLGWSKNSAEDDTYRDYIPARNAT